jgi:quercetin dioxygenase-like cupin family protein
MRIVNYKDVEGHEDVPGVVRRVVVGPEHGAPRFAMRVFELQPGASTPYHSHDWEHEVFVLSGSGVAKRDEGDTPISEGTAVFVPPNETHCFTNNSDGLLRIICCIPNTTNGPTQPACGPR